MTFMRKILDILNMDNWKSDSKCDDRPEDNIYLSASNNKTINDGKEFNSGTEIPFVLSDEDASDINRISYYLSMADMYAIKLNKTTNVYDFFTLYSNVENILVQYIQYEKYGIFKESLPSKDLKSIRKRKVIIEKAFIDRSFNYYKSKNELFGYFRDLYKNINKFSKNSAAYIDRLRSENIDLIYNSNYMSTNKHTEKVSNTNIHKIVLKNKDIHFIEAGEYVIRQRKASIGMLQLHFKIGFNYASKIMDELCEAGVVSEEYDIKPREILLSIYEFRELCNYYYTVENYVPDSQLKNVNMDEPEYNIFNYDNMDGIEFENFCSDLLERNGFCNVEVTQGSGDHGIDVLAEKDGISYAIQCKCYSSNIGNAAIQQAHTGKSLYRKDIAVVMTNRFFTQQAINEANELGVKLWDRNKLNEMIEKAK